MFAGHHQPLRVWVAALYLMGLNLSRQIAHELGLNEDDAQSMTQHLRRGVVETSTTPTLSGTVEIDEVYLVAGHKGQHAEVQKAVKRGQPATKRAQVRCSGQERCSDQERGG